MKGNMAMKKLKTLFLGLGLSVMFIFAGCGKAPVDPAVVSTIESNRETLIKEIAMNSEKTALANITEEDYKIKADEFEGENLKFASKDTYVGAVNSCLAAEDEAGSITGYDRNITISGNPEDGYKVTELLGYTGRNVNMNIAYDGDLNITDITFSPIYSMGEAMTKAALNTLLGMGSVFSVLILIMIIIYLFGIIPKIQKASADKKAKKTAAKAENKAALTNANVVETETEELVDDYELVAVISAAIAAYEGSGSTDGFVVRSIRKSQSKKWQNAQY
jgi:sodium pump decarboxylase gamma subunit